MRCLFLLFFVLFSTALRAVGPGNALRIRPFSLAYTAPFRPLHYWTGGFTFECWIRSTSRSWAVISAAQQGGTDNAVLFGSGVVSLLQTDFNVPFQAPELLVDGLWHHYAWVFLDEPEPKNQTVELIIDGQPNWLGTASQRINSSVFHDPAQKFSLVVGLDQDSYIGDFVEDEGLDGWIDELRFWAIPRDQLDIQREMYNRLPEAGSSSGGPAASWHFDPTETLFSGTGETTALWINEASGSHGLALLGVDFRMGTLPETTGLYGSSLFEIGLAAAGCTPPQLPQLTGSGAPVLTSADPMVQISATVNSTTSFALLFRGEVASVELLSSFTADVAVLDTTGHRVPPNQPLSLVNASFAGGLGLGAPLLLHTVDAQTGVTQFTYRVTAPASSGGDVIFGTITVVVGNPPTCSNLTIEVKQNADITFSLPVADSEGDPVRGVVESAPFRGVLVTAQATSGLTHSSTAHLTDGSEVGGDGQSVNFKPFANEKGPLYAVLRFAARASSAQPDYSLQGIVAQRTAAPLSKICTVSFTVLPQEPATVLQAPTVVQLQEDTAADFPVAIIEAGDFLPVLTITILPPNATVTVVDQSGSESSALTTAHNSQHEVTQFASEVVEVSSAESAANLALGPTNQDSWYPLTPRKCENLEPERNGVTSFFYSEFLTVRFAKAVFPTSVIIYETDDTQGSVVRVKGRRDSYHEWVTLWAVAAPKEPKFRRNGFAPSICRTPYPIRELRLELDTCNLPSWKGINAVSLWGTDAATQTYFSGNTTFRIRPAPNWNGVTTLGYYYSSCLGDLGGQSLLQKIDFNVAPVNDAPHAAVLQGSDVVSNAFGTVFVLSGTDIDSQALYVRIVQLPDKGSLIFNEHPITNSSYYIKAPLEVVYRPKSDLLCGSPFEDAFTFETFDGELVSGAQLVQLTSLQCDKCPDGTLLSGSRCQPCPSGFFWKGGSCSATASKVRVTLAAASGASSFIVLSALLFFVLRRTTKARRALSSAPSGVVTLVVTDIQDSSKIWDWNPRTMRASLVVHNRVLRACIAVAGGYEVKTQGDSFIVAFPNHRSAVRFLVESQAALLSAEWPCELLEHPSCCEEKDSSGQTVFRGFRVRMGAHSGTVDRQYNPSTRKVEYYGRTVNVAARIESLAKGGQILLSEPVSCSVQPTVADVIFLGSFPLPGISKPCEIFQMSPSCIRPREFDRIDTTSVMEPGRAIVGEQECITCQRKLRCNKCWSSKTQREKQGSERSETETVNSRNSNS